MFPKFGINFFTSPTFIYQQFFCNNLTAYHKELQVFVELMDNRCAIHVIRQDILDQVQKYILLNSFCWLNYIKVINVFQPLKPTMGKITTHCSTIQITHFKVRYVFWRFFRIIIFHVNVICFTVSFSNVRNPPLSHL